VLLTLVRTSRTLCADGVRRAKRELCDCAVDFGDWVRRRDRLTLLAVLALGFRFLSVGCDMPMGNLHWQCRFSRRRVALGARRSIISVCVGSGLAGVGAVAWACPHDAAPMQNHSCSSPACYYHHGISPHAHADIIEE